MKRKKEAHQASLQRIILLKSNDSKSKLADNRLLSKTTGNRKDI